MEFNSEIFPGTLIFQIIAYTVIKYISPKLFSSNQDIDDFFGNLLLIFCGKTLGEIEAFIIAAISFESNFRHFFIST